MPIIIVGAVAVIFGMGIVGITTIVTLLSKFF